MNEKEHIEKDDPSDTSSDAKVTKSADTPNRGKERQKLYKKKKSRSATKSRLGGGADEAEDSPTIAAESVKLQEEPQEEPVDNEIGQSHTSADGISTTRSRPTSESQHLKRAFQSTGDPRVDEMMDNALQNLGEAEKALTTLGENVQHDLKLLLVELIGRTRKWANQVDNKIDWARKDLNELNKELLSRIAALEEAKREAGNLRDMLNQAEAYKEVASKAANDPKDNMPTAESASVSRSVQLHQPSSSKQPSRCQSRILQGDPYAVPVDMATLRAEAERLQQCCEEFEQEVLCLRKENEKMVKERAEYENAIQRALLKGVSSLNTEALKVLKCTPMPACCPPCTPSTTIEPVPKMQYPSSPGPLCSSPCPPYPPATCPSQSNNNSNKHCGGRNGSRNNSKETLNNGGRRACLSGGHHSERKSRRSRDNGGMLLLLNQRDAENMGIPTNNTKCCAGMGNK